MKRIAKLVLIAPVVLTSQMLSSWTVVSSSEQMAGSSSSVSSPSSSENIDERGFILRDNGDHAKKGYGSVTDEVKAFYSGSSDFSKYLSGTEKGSSGLFFAQSKESVYFYTYDENARQDFSYVSMDAVEGDFENGGQTLADYVPTYKSHSIEMVSYSADGRLVKWKTNLPVSSSDRVYYVRELVGDGKYMEVSGRYYIKASGEEHVTPIETVTITSKDVAWQNTNLDNTYVGSQFHYVAFDTDIRMDSVSKIEIEYQAKFFGGRSDISKGYLDGTGASDVSEKIKGVDFRNSFDDPELYFEYPIVDLGNLPEESTSNSAYEFSTGGYGSDGTPYIHETITPSVISSTYESGYWWWKTSHTYNMTTLSSYEDLVKANPDETILSDNNLASKHEWFCCFLQNEYRACYNSNMSGAAFIHDDHLSFGLSNYQTYNATTAKPKAAAFSSDYMPIDIMDLSILKLTYEKDGITHDAVALDTYDDSKGTSNIVDPTVDTLTSRLKGFFNKVGDWFGDYGLYVVLGVLAVLAIILLPALGNFFSFLWKIIKLIGKALWWLISAPFKGIKKIIDKAQGERE